MASVVNPSPCVMVLDADAPPALAFVRSLGRAGIKVGVFSPRSFPVARASRFCTYFGACPDMENTSLFLTWLKREVGKGYVEWVAPTSDLIAFYMACFPEAFPVAQADACCDLAQTEALLFKDRFHRACEANGVATPWSVCPRTVEEACDMASEWPYPLILKPKSHVGVGHARGQVVYTADELRQFFKPYPVAPERRMLMERYPELGLPMIQEYVPNALQHLYSISGVFDHEGTIAAYSAAKKTRQWPPRLGVGIVFEPWHHPEIEKEGLKLVQALMSRGIFELEYIFDARHNRYVAIDLNPRAHGHIAFDIARGLDLPLYWYRAAKGLPQAPVQPRVGDLKWLHGVPFHVGSWVQLMKGPHRFQALKHYMSDWSSRHVDIVFDWGDPLPACVHTAFMLRHPGGLIRPFWQEDTL